jgi:hypothetical protein
MRDTPKRRPEHATAEQSDAKKRMRDNTGLSLLVSLIGRDAEDAKKEYPLTTAEEYCVRYRKNIEKELNKQLANPSYTLGAVHTVYTETDMTTEEFEKLFMPSIVTYAKAGYVTKFEQRASQTIRVHVIPSANK